MARVLICSDSPYINTGFSNVGRFIGKTLHEAKHEVMHLGFSDPRPDAASTKWGGRTIPWTVLQTVGKGPDDRFAQRSYGQILLSADPELVIIVADIWNINHILLNTPCPTILLAHIEGEPLPTKLNNEFGQEIIIPQILSHANLVISAGPFGKKVIQERMLDFCVNTKKNEDEIKAVMNNTSLIIPDAVDTDVFKPIPRQGLKAKLFKGVTDENFIIGYFGRQNPRKGLPYALEAFARWKDRPDNVLMYLHTAIKDKTGWNLPQLLRDLNITDKIIIDPTIKVGGGCSEEVLNALYNACFIPGTPVLTKHGYRPIEHIEVGDTVISAQGKQRKVLATSKRRYKGKYLSVKTSRSQVGPVCTPNHKFWIMGEMGTEGPVYCAAENLQKGDIILTPVVKIPGLESSEKPFILENMCRALEHQHALVTDRKIDSILEPLTSGLNVRRRRGRVPHYKFDGMTYIPSVVESIEPVTIETSYVHNIEVEEDHSYVACGLGVKNCDITVLPSSGEGAGLTLCESSSAGVPCITTDYAESPNYVDGVCELIRPAAYWVEPVTNIRRAIPDMDQLIQKIKKLHREPKYREQLGIRAREKMVANFDTKIVAKKWVELADRVSKIQPMMQEKQIAEIAQRQSVAVSNGKKKVCFIGSYFIPDLIGGGEITYYKLLKEFQARGWEAHSFICRDGISNETVVTEGISVTRCTKELVEKKVASYLGALRPDVVITTLIDPEFTKAALMASKKVGATTIYYEQFYNSIVTKYRDVMSLSQESIAPWGREVLSMCDLIYSNGPFVQGAMQKYQGFASKILHPFIDFKDVVCDKWDPKYVTMINPDPGKGGHSFLYIVKAMPEVDFLTVKVSDKNDYRALSAMGPQANLKVMDFQRDMRKVYENTKLLLVPTIVDETFCRVIPEAQANGIPVIARDVGGIKNTMGKGGIVLAKHEDDDIWVSAIRYMLGNTDDYAQYSKAARENAKKIDYAAEFDSLFKDIEQVKRIDIIEKKSVCCITPDFAGVQEVFNNIGKLYSDSVNVITINVGTAPMTIMERIIAANPKVVVFGAWIPYYMEIMKNIRRRMPQVKICCAWFSNFSQMEFSTNNELGIFNEIKRKLNDEKPIIDEIWMSSEEDGKILNQSEKKVKYLPCPLLISKPAVNNMKIRVDGKINVSIFCTPGPRKNISNQIVGCAGIPNLVLHLNGISNRPEFRELLTTLKIDYRDHGWMDKDTYLAAVSQMDACLQVTFAETFNYVVAEHMMYGVPCIVSAMVPILSRNQDLKEITVFKADSPNEIREKILLATGPERGRFTEASKRCIMDVAKSNNLEIKELLGI